MDHHVIDIYVGSRVRLRRMGLHISQEKLGDALELTFQQIQKYERGINRISAGRLWHMAEVLDVPISYFFSDFIINDNDPSSSLSDISRETAIYTEDRMSKRETMDLVQAYYCVPNKATRRRIIDLIRSLSQISIDVTDEAKDVVYTRDKPRKD